MAAMVTADGSRETARAAAVHLARLVWDARKQFHYGCETAELEEGVARALAAKQSTVFLTDCGDNVTASTPGDLPVVLRLPGRAQGERRPGGPGGVRRGCHPAMLRGGPGQPRPRLDRSDGREAARPAAGGRGGGPAADEDARRGWPWCASGGMEAVLEESVVEFIAPENFKPLEIDPLSRKIVVVKEGYLYPKLSKIAPRHILLLTPGAADLRIEKLDYVRLRRPIYPLEPEMAFEPEKV